MFALGAWRYPVAANYHEVRCGEAPPLPPAAQTFAALVRTDYVTRTIPLSEAHYFFLKAMADGGSVDDAIEAVAGYLGVAPDGVRRPWHDPQGARQRWIDWGFFVEAE